MALEKISNSTLARSTKELDAELSEHFEVHLGGNKSVVGIMVRCNKTGHGYLYPLDMNELDIVIGELIRARSKLSS